MERPWLVGRRTGGVHVVEPSCPDCHASGNLIEDFGHGWFWCGVCCVRWLLDEAGTVLRVLH